MEKWLKSVILGAFVFALIVAFFSYGLETRSIVKYNIQSCPEAIQYSSTSNININLGIQNSGNSDASIFINLNGTNIDFEVENKPYIDNDMNGKIAINLNLPKNMTNFDYSHSVKGIVKNNSDNFEYFVTIDKKTPLTISGVVNLIFGEVTPIYPTVCRYEKSGNEFILLE